MHQLEINFYQLKLELSLLSFLCDFSSVLSLLYALSTVVEALFAFLPSLQWAAKSMKGTQDSLDLLYLFEVKYNLKASLTMKASLGRNHCRSNL